MIDNSPVTLFLSRLASLLGLKFGLWLHFFQLRILRSDIFRFSIPLLNVFDWEATGSCLIYIYALSFSLVRASYL